MFTLDTARIILASAQTMPENSCITVISHSLSSPKEKVEYSLNTFRNFTHYKWCITTFFLTRQKVKNDKEYELYKEYAALWLMLILILIRIRNMYV